MSNLRKFKQVSEARIKELQQNRLKRRTFAKMQWGVRAFREWRNIRLSDPVTYDYRIYESDIDMPQKLNPKVFEFAMCKFIAEVTKVKDGSDYPGKTLYQMCIAIQNHLHQKGLKWKLVESEMFSNLRTVLDNVMKERAALNIGMVRRQANVISLEFESKLWEQGVLGEQNPDQLRDTVLFLLGINVGLRAGDEHYSLRRNSENRESQLTFKVNSKGVKCLVYTEDTVTKANDGGLKHMRNDRKIVWVYPSEDVVRCPVRLVEKYMKLLPAISPNTKKYNFYLRSLEKFTPTQWYGEQVVGVNTLKKVTQKLLKNAKLDGFFTNHSLRRSGSTRLFTNGIDRKLVKEFTGHRSDAVDQYQITSDEQRQEMSEIIGGKKKQESVENVSKLELSVGEQSPNHSVKCSCSRQEVKISETAQLGQVINEIVNVKNRGKATIKIEITFDQ